MEVAPASAGIGKKTFGKPAGTGVQAELSEGLLSLTVYAAYGAAPVSLGSVEEGRIGAAASRIPRNPSV
ncbi:hypothetical protein ACTHPH_09520 [Paenibacillus pasadenensis]|uniref:hypothetical protein n=1 Tax=Paenibacillus pasadenensis TaxID=217090 RepID=UPI00042961F2|nr:hypothetical protein [Paenibacillus pasadenensis]